MNSLRFSCAAAGLIFCLFANNAFAQYVWIDEKGVKQFSDMPPPTNVPTNRILKKPGGAAVKASAESDDQASDGAAKPASTQAKGPMTAAEQNAEFKKRRAEQAEKEKKSAEQAKRDADKTNNCDRARGYLRSLESGERVSQMDKNGERSYLSDEQREREIENARRIVADCK